MVHIQRMMVILRDLKICEKMMVVFVMMVTAMPSISMTWDTRDRTIAAGGRTLDRHSANL